MSSINRLPTDQKVKPRAVYWTNRQLAWLKQRALNDETQVGAMIRKAMYEKHPELEALE